jgi:hypothetical protein
VTTSVAVDAPQEGRPQTRINWMLRQLREAPDDLRIDVGFANVRETTSVLLKDARERPQQLLAASGPKREPRGFMLALSRPMGTKRGKGERSFVAETRKQAVDFYRSLVQNLRAWQPSPPKLPDEPAPEQVPETPTPETPPFTTNASPARRAILPRRPPVRVDVMPAQSRPLGSQAVTGPGYGSAVRALPSAACGWRSLTTTRA